MKTACTIILPLSHLIDILAMYVSFGAGISVIVLSIGGGLSSEGNGMCFLFFLKCMRSCSGRGHFMLGFSPSKNSLSMAGHTQRSGSADVLSLSLPEGPVTLDYHTLGLCSVSSKGNWYLSLLSHSYTNVNSGQLAVKHCCCIFPNV